MRAKAEQKLHLRRLKSGLWRRGHLLHTSGRHFASLVRGDRTTGVASRVYYRTFQAHWESEKVYLLHRVRWLGD
ncbi:protein of unknown function [Hyphomicrobium sp. MC1]|nr:protein of unknown function [Hyphomicrobium sp. MC1]